MKYKYRNIITVFFLLLITLNLVPSVLGKTRGSYLVSFIKNNEIEGIGFTNANDGNALISYEATAHALEILDDYGTNPHKIDTLQDNLEDKIRDMFSINQVNLFDLYCLMKSLDILEHEIDFNLRSEIYKYLNETEQIEGGFSFSNSSSIASLTSTYYVIQLYSLINEPIDNLTVHKNWILSCYNTDGGYGGNQSLSSNLLNTYFVVSLLDEFWNITNLVDINQTISYIKSFYVNNSADIDNYGGYLPDDSTQYAMLSSSYFCVKSLSLIDPGEINKDSTISWLLTLQNFEDGGFSDNTEGDNQKKSSVIASYFAFKILKILNPSLSSLSNDIWMVEFNYWILVIILICIVVVIGIIVFIWRKKRL